MSDVYGLSRQSADLFEQWRDAGTEQPADGGKREPYPRIALIHLEPWEGDWSNLRQCRPGRIVRFEVSTPSTLGSESPNPSPILDWYCKSEEGDVWYGTGGGYGSAVGLTGYTNTLVPTLYVGVLVGYNPGDGKPVYVGHPSTPTATAFGGNSFDNPTDHNAHSGALLYHHGGRWWVLPPGAQGSVLTMSLESPNKFVPKWVGSGSVSGSAPVLPAIQSTLHGCPVETSPPPPSPPPPVIVSPPASPPPPVVVSPPTGPGGGAE